MQSPSGAYLHLEIVKQTHHHVQYSDGCNGESTVECTSFENTGLNEGPCVYVVAERVYLATTRLYF